MRSIYIETFAAKVRLFPQKQVSLETHNNTISMYIFLTILAVLLAAGCGIAAYAVAAERRHRNTMAAELELQRSRAAESETRCIALEGTIRSMETESAERLKAKELELVAARKDIESLREKLEAQETGQRERNEKLMLQFEKAANEIFEKKNLQFRTANRESLDSILNPLKENISAFRKRVEEIYSQENENRGAFKAELRNLTELNRRITEETSNLTSALRGNSKIQGDWGETVLDTILESSNLRKGIHYFPQANIKDANGNNIRPDVILKLPDDKRIVIDSKVSLTDYVNYCSCEDEEGRRRAMAAHLRSVRKHVNELGAKNYQESVLGSPDFVIMFVPIEPAFISAVQNDPELWNDAYQKKIIICSPTNLFGMLKIVDDLWKRDDIGKNAERIAQEGAKMYDKLVTFAETFMSIGKGIETLQGNYDRALTQLSSGKGNLVSRAEKLRKLKVNTNKQLPQQLLDNADMDEENVTDESE